MLVLAPHGDISLYTHVMKRDGVKQFAPLRTVVFAAQAWHQEGVSNGRASGDDTM